MSGEVREVGKTADVGYQIGVRRTIDCGEEELWSLLLSPEGMASWLGGAIDLTRGASYSFPDGTRGGQIDAFARAPLWAAGVDYAHGTGHGVGLEIHEAPRLGLTDQVLFRLFVV